MESTHQQSVVLNARIAVDCGRQRRGFFDVKKASSCETSHPATRHAPGAICDYFWQPNSLAVSFVLLLVVANLKAAELREVSRRTILTAAGLGALAALAATTLLFGLRSNISQLRAWSFLAVKFAFAGPIIAVSLACLVRGARHLYGQWRPHAGG
jgi:hypothetical protein